MATHGRARYVMEILGSEKMWWQVSVEVIFQLFDFLSKEASYQSKMRERRLRWFEDKREYMK